MPIDLFFDIETIPDQRENAFDRYLDQVKPPGNYKKQETIDNWMFENAERIAGEEYLKTGLNGLHGEICSIGWALADGEVQALTRSYNNPEDLTEAQMLEKFWAALDYQLGEHFKEHGLKRNYSNYSVCWIGHNVLDFDLRFLKQRSLVSGIKPPYTVPADARHPSDLAYDTMKEWAGWRGYVKLAELVEVFGIEKPEWIDEDILSIDGSKIWELFSAGESGLIHEYNRLDVYYTREVYKRLRYR